MGKQNSPANNITSISYPEKSIVPLTFSYYILNICNKYEDKGVFIRIFSQFMFSLIFIYECVILNLCNRRLFSLKFDIMISCRYESTK